MEKKNKRISWRPYSKKDTNDLLASLPIVGDKIKAVKITNWFNKRRNMIEFGIMAKGESGYWCHLCTDTRAILFDDIRIARKVTRVMNKEIKNNPERINDI